MSSENQAVSGHQKIETSNFLMIVLVLLTIIVGGAVEIIPLFFQRSTTQPVEGLKPYTALQLAGRDVQFIMHDEDFIRQDAIKVGQS